MTSILFLIDIISDSQFRCIYPRNKKYFLNLFLHFLNLSKILNIFQKKMILIADVFPNFRTSKNVVKLMSKKCRFNGLWQATW